MDDYDELMAPKANPEPPLATSPYRSAPPQIKSVPLVLRLPSPGAAWGFVALAFGLMTTCLMAHAWLTAIVWATVSLINAVNAIYVRRERARMVKALAELQFEEPYDAV